MKYLKFFGNSSEVGDGVNVETPNISYLYKTNTVFVSKRKGKNATIVYDQEDGKIEYQPYEPVPLQSLSISGETNVMSTATYSVQYTPSYTFETGVTWSIVSGSEYASINPNTGVLTALSAASSSEVVIRATSIPNSAITAQKTLSVSYPSLQSISISGETNVGNTATYTVVYTPSNTPQKGVTWSIVSGSEYASINASTGVLTALSGASDSEVVIKATSAVNSGITDQKTLSVSYVVALQSISISGETDVTNSSAYSVQYTPSNTTQTGVTWSIISGSQYASINASTGALTVLSGASSSVVIIKATSVVNSAITAQKTISVSYVVPLQSISISGETNVTGSTTYTVQYTPSNTTQTGVTWSIVSGSEYASINVSTGLLTALYGASGSEVVIKATSAINSAITAQKTLSVTYPSGPQYVEIGGIKWAKWNVGATGETDYGLYFQWGDTTGYTRSQIGVDKNFSWTDYKFNNDGSSPSESNMTKYNPSDGKSALDLSDDAARAAYGGNWRMPTMEEFNTLKNAVTTAWTSNYQSTGVAGLICTSKTDSSKKLFFPANGLSGDGVLNNLGVFACYLSKNIYRSQYIYCTTFDVINSGASVIWDNRSKRFSGRCVRAILDE